MAITSDIFFNTTGKAFSDVGFVAKSHVHVAFPRGLRFLVKGVAELDSNIFFNTLGKTYADQPFNVIPKTISEVGFVAKAVDLFAYIYHFTEKEISDFSVTSVVPINEVTLMFGYDFEDGRYRASITKKNPVSKELYGDDPTYTRRYEMQHIQDQAVANKIADGILYASSFPEIFVSFKHNLKSLYVEENDPVAITHLAGLDVPNGYSEAGGYVTKRSRGESDIQYEVSMNPLNSRLLKSDFVKLTLISSTASGGSITIELKGDVLITTVYSTIEGSPALEGVEVTINSIKKLTNSNGQAFFENFVTGTYTAYLVSPGYEDLSVTFTV